MGVRFAPSPTGAFHVGNFRTAWISKQWATALKQPWVVRFEDIDKPRIVAGAQELQLGEMAELGLVPDEILLQSRRIDRHRTLFEQARKDGAIYPCTCSRKDVLDALASAPHGPEALYSGHCRKASLAVLPGSVAWRFRDADESGEKDFLVARVDQDAFMPSYHWACAIDDADGGYSLLVRAHDLAAATLQQRKIQTWMGRKNYPAVFHTSLVVTNDRHRLEKRTQGVTWKELKACGLAPAELLAIFRKSFSVPIDEFAAQKIFGESNDSLTLTQLGL